MASNSNVELTGRYNKADNEIPPDAWVNAGSTGPRFTQGARSPRAMDARTPGLGDPGTSIQSIYGPLNSSGTAYRIGLQIAIALIICQFVAIIVWIEYTYTKDFDEMMMHYKKKPLKLLSIFFCCYVIGCVILIPPSTVLIVCAYTFTHDLRTSATHYTHAFHTTRHSL